MRVKPMLFLLPLVALLAACSSDGQPPLALDQEASVASTGAGDSGAGGLSVTPIGGAGDGLTDDEVMTEALPAEGDGYSYDTVQYPNASVGSEFRDPGNPLSKSVIYFLYDSSQVQQDFVPVIAAHARYLVKHPFNRVTLAGHADERGSPEYNIALGEYRAKAVARMLKVQGVSDDQLQIVSFGEEKPASPGHDEASWQLNRRVEILYQGRQP